jgi:MFS family permease
MDVKVGVVAHEDRPDATSGGGSARSFAARHVRIVGVTFLRSTFARWGAGLPPSFWWLWTGLFISALATFVFPFLALFLTARGFTVEQAGLVLSLFGGGSMLAGVVAGFLADHVGRRPTLLFSLIATAALCATLAILSSLVAIAVVVLAFGIASNAFRPALSAMVADVVPKPQRRHAYGLVYWANNLGMAVSLIVGGALASHGYRTLFLADAATTLVFVALLWRNVPESLARPAEDAGETGDRRGYAAVLSDSAFVAFLIVNLAFIVVLFQFQVAMPVDMARHGLKAAAFGRVLSVNGLLIATIQPFSARLTRRFEAAHVLAFASLLLGAGYGSYAFCRTATHYALGTAVWSLGEIFALPVASALVADLSPPDLRGRYQGLLGLTGGLSLMLAPIIGSTILGRLGSGALWTGCAVLGVAVATGHLAIAGPRRRALAARVADLGEVSA